MKILVTGGNGFLGQHFVRAHKQRGDEVIAVDDLSAHPGEPVPKDLEPNLLVMDALEFFKHEQSQWDRAYHFAAPVGGREKIEGDPLFNAHSLALDEGFFRWAVGRVETVVYPSSSAVYGVRFQGDTHRALSETLFLPAQAQWFSPDEMYGFTKLVGEVLAWKCAAYGLNALCIRPFSGYGEGQGGEYPVPAIARRVIAREDPLVIWGSGRQTRDLIHVSDIVGLTLERLEYPVKGYYAMNLGSGFGLTFRQIAEIMVSLVEDYSPAIITDDKKPQGVLHRRSDTGLMETWGKPVITVRDGLRRVLEYEKRRQGHHASGILRA